MTSPKLSHYSQVQLKKIKSVPQEVPSYKPKGLWVSVDGPNDWPHYLDGLDAKPGRYHYRIDLDFKNILQLCSRNDLKNFTHRYKKYACGEMFSIHWVAVAQEYQGIVISPWMNSFNLSLNLIWYYGWDCASGCIWDANAIRNHTLTSVSAP